MAKHKYIETPEKLWELFEAYVTKTKATPFKVKDWVGKDGFQVEREKEKPLTMEGFEIHVFRQGLNTELKDYFANRDEKYSVYSPICSHIRLCIREDQIAGGMAGIYNPSITQRLNGLTEKTENQNTNITRNINVQTIPSEAPIVSNESEIKID